MNDEQKQEYERLKLQRNDEEVNTIYKCFTNNTLKYDREVYVQKLLQAQQLLSVTKDQGKKHSTHEEDKGGEEEHKHESGESHDQESHTQADSEATHPPQPSSVPQKQKLQRRKPVSSQ
jgi:ABC-type Zn2+ transport system substrate-binding protein/surface adhesin